METKTVTSARVDDSAAMDAGFKNADAMTVDAAISTSRRRVPGGPGTRSRSEHDVQGARSSEGDASSLSIDVVARVGRGRRPAGEGRARWDRCGAMIAWRVDAAKVAVIIVSASPTAREPVRPTRRWVH